MIQPNEKPEEIPEFTPKMMNALIGKILIDLKGVTISRKALENPPEEALNIKAVYNEQTDTYFVHVPIPKNRRKRKIVTPKLALPKSLRN
jgi:hypothetical protein